MIIESSYLDRVAPHIQQIGPELYQLVQDFRYNHRDCFSIFIKKGFITDGASIPRALWFICGSPFSGGNYVTPAILHDGLYSAELFPRAQCDLTFYEAQSDWEVPFYSREAKYIAVRTCGWGVWMKHTEESVSLAREFVSIEWKTEKGGGK